MEIKIENDLVPAGKGSVIVRKKCQQPYKNIRRDKQMAPIATAPSYANPHITRVKQLKNVPAFAALFQSV